MYIGSVSRDRRGTWSLHVSWMLILFPDTFLSERGKKTRSFHKVSKRNEVFLRDQTKEIAWGSWRGAVGSWTLARGSRFSHLWIMCCSSEGFKKRKIGTPTNTNALVPEASMRDFLHAQYPLCFLDGKNGSCLYLWLIQLLLVRLVLERGKVCLGGFAI